METIIALWIIFFISIAGILFSGFLTIKEMKIISCSVEKKKGKVVEGSCGIRIFGLPTCLYGFIMYMIVLIICIMTLFF